MRSLHATQEPMGSLSISIAQPDLANTMLTNLLADANGDISVVLTHLAHTENDGVAQTVGLTAVGMLVERSACAAPSSNPSADEPIIRVATIAGLLPCHSAIQSGAVAKGVVRAMRPHIKDGGVLSDSLLRRGCQALQALSDIDGEQRSLVAAAGGGAAMTDVLSLPMVMAGSTAVQLACLSAVKVLVAPHGPPLQAATGIRRSVVNAGGMEVVVRNMNGNLASHAVQREGCSALAAFARTSVGVDTVADIRSAALKSDAVYAAARAMQRYPASLELQLTCMHTLHLLGQLDIDLQLQARSDVSGAGVRVPRDSPLRAIIADRAVEGVFAAAARFPFVLAVSEAASAVLRDVLGDITLLDTALDSVVGPRSGVALFDAQFSYSLDAAVALADRCVAMRSSQRAPRLQCIALAADGKRVQALPPQQPQQLDRSHALTPPSAPAQ